MEQGVSFSAPWGVSLRLITGFTVLILVCVPIIGLCTGPRDAHAWYLWYFPMVALPLAILIISAFFSIRGYVLTHDSLLIRRVGWESKVNLSGLVSVEADPRAMAHSIRTFGNGGLFSITGKFRNKKLGPYRAFATDPNKSVILRFNSRVVVVTPANPPRKDS